MGRVGRFDFRTVMEVVYRSRFDEESDVIGNPDLCSCGSRHGPLQRFDREPVRPVVARVVAVDVALADTAAYAFFKHSSDGGIDGKPVVSPEVIAYVERDSDIVEGLSAVDEICIASASRF